MKLRRVWHWYACAALVCPCAHAWESRIDASAFARSELVPPEAVQRIREGGNLGGRPQDCCIAGWVEYDFTVPESGWYELFAAPGSPQTEFFVDPTREALEAPALVQGSYGSAEPQKVMNAWLEAGAHRLRVQQNHWTGFPRTRGFVWRNAPATLSSNVGVSMREPRIYRVGECPPLAATGGGLMRAARLGVQSQRKFGEPATRIGEIAFAPSEKPQQRELRVPCDAEGSYIISFIDGERAIPWNVLRPVDYEVVDVRVAKPERAAAKRVLVQEFDAAQRAPDYEGGGSTRVVTSAAGAYRESGDTGWTAWQRASPAARRALPEPSWFAYRLDGLTPQAAHLVEVEFPDDALRTFAIALRESALLAYPVAGGADTGGEFSLSRRMQQESLLFWPRAEQPRLVFLNAHSGRRAAAGRVRVYRIEGALPPLARSERGARQFVNWYEEGGNFLSLYGLRDGGSPAALQEAVERWAEAAAASGYSALMPTAVVYESALYPSRFNRVFSRPDQDLLRRIVLAAEKYDLRVVPELHPRADELEQPFLRDADPKPNLLLSRDGRSNFFQGDGRTRNYPPLHDLLHPDNRAWYLGMVRELALRYRDSPALAGVSVRLWQWANPGLDHFHSLDWGYSESMFRSFLRDTRMAPPERMPAGDTSAAARARYAWLTGTVRDQWIRWRCEKVAALFTELRAALSAVRPDLVLVANLTTWPGQEQRLDQAWREAGIDPALLARIDGVIVLQATLTYGRREADELITQRARDLLLDPALLNAVHPLGATPAFLTAANYLEATDAVVPPESLGFPAQTRRTWMSAVANPAGANALERYALPLAETDAQWLGDGGNGYSLTQPAQRDFVRRFRALPAERFSPRPDARDPVAVWTLSRPNRFWFYAVNRERYEVKLHIDLAGATEVVAADDGRARPLRAGALELALGPYELAVFRAGRGASIRAVRLEIPQAARAAVAAQVRWIVEQAAQQPRYSLSVEQRALLARAAEEADRALGEGRLWRARTLLEAEPLLEIYGVLGRRPPGLRDGTGAKDAAR
jgi:hypothetical protein